VHRTGGMSWRFEVGTATALSVALRCRDELGTPVPPSPDVPPGVASPARTTAPDAGLAVAWLVWWRLLLDRTAAGMRPDQLPGLRRHVLVPDALELAADGPLRQLAADAADRHTADARRAWSPPGDDVRPPPPLLSSVLRDAAFDTAGRHHVPAEDLWGGVHRVPGPAGWSAVVRPGYGLMTDHGDALDEGAQYRFVRAVLESGIRTD
jgi:hypothetical protein